MTSSTLGGTVNDIARGHILPPCREGRVSKVLADRLEVAVRSLNGDVQTLAARGWHPQIEDADDGPVMILPKRGDRAWVADDEGRALVVVTWQRIGESDTVSLVGPEGPTGPTGATGATGATGPTGPAGPTVSTAGANTLVFSASNLAVRTVTHGLGSTPVAIAMNAVNIPPSFEPIFYDTVGATTFRAVQYSTGGGNITGTTSFSWIAHL